MELLRPKSKWPGRLLALTMTIAGAGCVLLDRLGVPGGTRYAFSHQVHVSQEGLDCVSCHESADVSDDPGMPSLDTCSACHETIDAAKPPERRVASLFEAGRFKAAHESKLDEEQVFSHKRHVTAKQDCKACHAGIESNQAIGPEIAVTMERCVDCHAQRQVANACATCHTQIRDDQAPASHQRNWKQMHGQVVRAHSEMTGDNCALCHKESLCITCHRDEPPRSHNNFFRMRGHGVAAMMDRQSCATCHEPDSCETCHAEVLPMSHRGLWGAPKDTHCLTCHFPLPSEGCIVCHKDTPSHLQATPLPLNPIPPIPVHNPAMNCRQCHGLSAPLPHVDKGDECTLCHL
ncbi:MAG TPA: cytochrome c3 family protein [Planctomycetota bacterium]|nr:cytochrome c3 family protein [Planctomycetota bacterium]